MYDYEQPHVSVDHILHWPGDQQKDKVDFAEMLTATAAPDILKLDYFEYYELMDQGLYGIMTNFSSRFDRIVRNELTVEEALSQLESYGEGMLSDITGY